MRRRGRSSTLGSTVIEVLMAITILAIGATGIIALQKTTTVANRNAKNLEIANEIARTWLERLRGDALMWNHPSQVNPNSDIGSDTVWLQPTKIHPPGSEVWFRPVTPLSGVHDALGQDDTTTNLDGPFCVNIRMTWLRTALLQRPGLIRAEVRVYWLRQNIQGGVGNLSMATPSPLCGPDDVVPPDVDSAPDLFHVIHAATAIAQNTAF